MQSAHIEEAYTNSTVTDEQFLQAIQDPEELKKEAFSLIMELNENEREEILRPYKEKYGKTIFFQHQRQAIRA